MPDTRDLLVRLIGDDRSLQAAFTRTERRTQQFQTRTATLTSGLSRGFAAAGITLGGVLVGREIRDSINAASDLNEQVTKSQQIFGESSQEIQDWSETTARSMGISQRAALTATGTFGNLFSTVGLAPEASAKMSQALVQLTADLASFNNASPDDVLLAIRSGLIGEAEPLRRYGVLLSEARVQQEALAATGKDNVKELTNQEKALARYRIIMQDTEKAQGDFARTSDGLANQTRILRANFDDLSANLGRTFLPAVNAAVGGVNKLFDGFDRLSDFGNTTLTIDINVPLDEIRRAREEVAALKGESDLMVKAFDAIIQRREASSRVDKGGLGDERGFIQGRLRDARLLDRDVKTAERELRESRTRFGAFLKGLGLKLDKAELTGSLADDQAVLREMERAILRQIDREGRTFKLIDQLTQVRSEIASNSAAQAQDAADRSRDAFEATIDALSLNLEIAETTQRLNDDLVALRAIERALLARIETEGRTTDLLRRLFQVRQQQNEAARELLQQKQFTELGLTPEGEKRGPSVRNLRERAARLEDQIKGTTLDTAKTRAQLERIAKVLSGQFGKVGKDVRAAILQMLNDIASALKEGDKATNSSFNEITRGGIRSTEMLTRGLGLTPEQEEELRKRNLGVRGRRGLSAFGFGIGNQPTTTGTSGLGFGGVQAETQIELRIFLDGKELENVVTTRQQKKGRRTSASRRGRAGANKLGVG